MNELAMVERAVRIKQLEARLKASKLDKDDIFEDLVMYSMATWSVSRRTAIEYAQVVIWQSRPRAS